MQRIVLIILHLPIFQSLRVLLGFSVQELVWLPSYTLMRGEFFRHAMSTPITVLAGCIDASIQSTPQNKSTLLQAREVCRSVERLVKKLTVPAEQDEAFEVHSATKECIRVCKVLHPEAIITLQSAHSTALTLSGSAIHWQEALSCAITNALEAYGYTATFRPVTVLVYQDAETLRLEIIDCASGMSALRRMIVRLPGITAKRAGSGLGLPFVQYVVCDLFSGLVEIESSPGRGTRMRWVIPIIDQ